MARTITPDNKLDNVPIRVMNAKPILVCLMANAHYKTQTYRPTDNA